MKQLKRAMVTILLLAIAFTFPLLSGTTGKIDGKIIDKANGEPQIGANIVIVGTSMGASSDVEGQYTILNVPPGVYSVQVTFVGYKRITVEDVRVYIDQTARVDIAMESQAIELGETIVLAERKLIKSDVATSVASVSDKEIETLPVSNVVSAIGLQAGIRGGWAGTPGYAEQPSYFTQNYTRGNISAGGPSIRGGSGDNILYMVDGITQRDPRNSEPTTTIALSAVKEISVERGGFNAEYGQVRSGLINVVTKEGAKRGYFGSIQGKMNPAGPRYERYPGCLDVTDPYSWALRPYFDPAVCWAGTDNGAWNEAVQGQYPSFSGWNKISKVLCTDDDPNNDLTPAGAQRAFEYLIRKRQINNQPDWDIDIGFGGPVPIISQKLGNLRFFASYRANDEMLLFPLSRPDYRSYDGSVQVNTDITPTLKLRFSALFGKQFTQRWSWDATGNYFYIHFPNDFVTAGGAGFGLFSDYNLSISDIGYRSYSMKFTHAVSPRTYYEISVDNYRRDYFTRPVATRDTSQKVEVLPGYYMSSFPFGYWNQMTGDLEPLVMIGTMHASKARDNSVVSATTVKADFSSQVNFKNLVKAGFEFVFNDLNLDYGRKAIDEWDYHTLMHVYPMRAGFYIQDKLETEGFTLNAGLRLDYSDPKVNWVSVSPYDATYYSDQYKDYLTTVFPTTKADAQWQLSPRLGIAHPITENSKLFFNYGHFKQIPQYEGIFRTERNQLKRMTSIGDPNLALAKTISYELGYDQILFEDYLLKIAAYYNDITDQQDVTVYNAAEGGWSYNKSTSNSYQDSRGFEITIQKSTGQWVTGFINYTYQVNTTGHFGHSQVFEDRIEQNNFNIVTTNIYQDRPIAQPFARLNLNFSTPDDWGPKVFKYPILGAVGLNVTADWQAGYWTTWNPKGVAAISYNVQAEDFWNTTLRADKYIGLGKFRVQLFMDISNVLDTRHLTNTRDQNYMASLHLPKSNVYPNIPGDDKVGAYRKPGVEYQPEEYQKEIKRNEVGKSYVIVFEGKSNSYWQYVDDHTIPVQDRWQKVDDARINQINSDKAYIDMPNQSTWWFLDPRRITFGLKLSFDFTE
jgi:hypothetical protein